MPETQAPAPPRPRVGYVDVGDPRFDPQSREGLLQDGDRHVQALADAGLDVVRHRKVVVSHATALEAIQAVHQGGVCGLVVRCAWFLRSHTIATLAQQSCLPVLLWAVPNPDDASYEGMALAHGALDELGINHEIHYGPAEAPRLGIVAAWARACLAKDAFMGAVYGEMGGRCLEMLPGSSDPNQLRKLFGIHVDPMEQFTLVRRAEDVPESAWRPVVDRVRASFRSVEATERSLERSARLYVAGGDLFRERAWSFAGIQCQLELIDSYLAPCLPVALWNEEGFVVSCETDVNNALGMFLCQNMTGRPAMFSDIFYMNPDERMIHVLNCGTAAPSVGGGAQRVNIREQTPLQGSWDEERQCSLCQGGACSQFILPEGPVTLVRFGRIDGEYVVHLARGTAVAHAFNPNELKGITQIWPFGYIRLQDEVSPESFTRHLRSHHTTVWRGDHAQAVRQFARLYGIPVLGA